MNILRRFTPLLVSIFPFFVYLFLLYQPVELFELGSIVALSFIIGLVVIIAGLVIIGHGYPLFSRLRFSPYLIFTWIGGLSIFLFTDSRALLITLSIVIPSMLFLWLESVYIFWQRSELYQTYTLQRAAGFLYLIALFLFIAGLTGLQVLLQIPMWLTSVIVALVFGIMQFDLLQLHRLEFKESLIFAGLGSILAHQLFVVLNLLPTHFFMYGLFSSLLFYIWNGIGCQVLKRQTQKLSQLSYIIIGSLGVVILFVSSLWYR